MNWSSHFQAVSSGNEPTASFGTTLFGKYTIAELQSLINGKDDEMTNLAKYVGVASQGWQSDLKALQGDYVAARANGLKAIAGAKYSIFADNLNPDGDAPYKAILSVINPRWAEHDASTDRVGLLMSRLNAEGIKVAPYTVRQPGAKDDAANYMQQHPVDYFIADPASKIAQGAADAGKAALTWSKPVLIAAVCVAGAVGLILVKTYLPPPHLGTLGARQP